jgi:hypothetical protein
MRYHEIIREDTAVDGLMSYWDLVDYYDLKDAADKLHDASLPWINRNATSAIARLATNKKMRLLSKLKLFCSLEGPRSYSDKWTTPEVFEHVLHQPVTMWRGGGGVYDPNYAYPLPWTSFTVKEARSETFSKYDGTRATRTFRLPLRDQYWIIKLTIPLDSILLYLPHGSDEEVIVSTEIARAAELVTQTNTGMANEVS